MDEEQKSIRYSTTSSHLQFLYGHLINLHGSSGMLDALMFYSC